ncbi:MAG TPA: NAD(P)-binding domain-containing protein [Kofleriaceae bacterium]
MDQGTYDLLVVGAGPAGLATAIEGQRQGLRVVVIDRGGLAEHIRQFPIGMAFFSPRPTLELAGIPLDVPRRHPTREDMLSYCVRVARVTGLEVRTGRALGAVTGRDGAFCVTLGDGADQVRTRKIVIATGVFGQARRMTGVPGLDLPKVSYGYGDPHAAAGLDVLIVGAGNGAAEAATRLVHAEARVTVLNRAPAFAETKWRWRLEDMAALMRAGAIRVMHQARISRIEPARVLVETPGGEVALRNDRVILLLGYEPSCELFDRLGIAYDPAMLAPRVDPISFESSVPGIHLAGCILVGRCPDWVFIHGARHHGKAIVARILGKPPPPIEDRGLDTVAHWRQFEALEDEIDAELALDLVPVVVGDHRDHLIDVHAHWADATGRTLGDPQQPFGSVVDAMEGWRFKSEPDGAGVLHGRRCSRDVLDLLRRADGTRRIRDIIEELTGEVEHSREELRAMVVPMFLALLRTGTIAWRASPLAPPAIR